MTDQEVEGPALRRGTAWIRRFGAALLLLGVSLPIAARAACQVTTLELPVKMVGSRAVATVGINGTEVPLMVDSGAFFSMLTEAKAAQLKLPLRRNFDLRVQGITGSIETFTTRVDTLQLLKGEVPRVEFLVGGNEPGAGTMGLMGRNLLSFADTEYDLAHGAIRFMVPNGDCDRSNMAYWADPSAVAEADLLTQPRSGRTPAIRVHARLNGSELVALLDSGATTVVSARAARRAGVEETAMTRTGTLRGGGRGSAKQWTAAFDKFELGGEAIQHNNLFVADFDLGEADMLLGVDFFLSHRIYVSKQQSKLFFTYNGGPVFAQDRVVAGSGAPAVEAGAAASGVAATTADEFARRGAAFAARNDLTGALADLDRACALEPTSAAWFAQRGAIHEALKHPTEALADFDKALELDPATSDARNRRAWLRFRTKDPDGAKADLDVLDGSLPAQAQLRLSMARLYLDLERLPQALDQLNQWLPAHPREARRDAVLNNRCAIRLRLGTELEQALDDCDAAVDAESTNPGYLTNRGWVQFRLGRYDKAISDFDRSLEARPEGAWALYGRGLARSKTGHAAEAEADAAAARKLLPDIDARAARAGFTAAPAPQKS